MKEDIVIPAWEIASKSSEIKFFNFIPSFFATLYLAIIILYQLAWSYINIFDLEDSFFRLIIDFIHSDSFWSIISTCVGLFILYILAIPIAQGGLIALIRRVSSENNFATEGRYPNIGFAITQGLRHFLPIFEANNITALFKLISIITFTLFLIRLLGSQYTPQIISGMTVYFAFAVVINIFLAYTRFFIVLEGKKAFDAIVASASMALSNLGITFKLYTTLLLVYIRTILTVGIFIILPFAFSAVLTYITTAGLRFISFLILGLIVFIFFIFISHLNSVLEIFVETLWFRAYIDNKSRSSEDASHSHDDHDNHHSHDSHNSHPDSNEHSHDSHGPHNSHDSHNSHGSHSSNSKDDAHTSHQH